MRALHLMLTHAWGKPGRRVLVLGKRALTAFLQVGSIACCGRLTRLLATSAVGALCWRHEQLDAPLPSGRPLDGALAGTLLLRCCSPLPLRAPTSKDEGGGVVTLFKCCHAPCRKLHDRSGCPLYWDVCSACAPPQRTCLSRWHCGPLRGKTIDVAPLVE